MDFVELDDVKSRKRRVADWQADIQFMDRYTWSTEDLEIYRVHDDQTTRKMEIYETKR